MSASHRVRRGRHRRHRQRARVLGALVAAALTGVAVMAGIRHQSGQLAAAEVAPPVHSPSAVVSTGVGTAAAPRSAASSRTDGPTVGAPGPDRAARRLRARRVPESGTGEFTVAPGASAMVGHGPRVTYSVEIERGLPLEPAAAAAVVHTVLSDDRGWTAVEARTLQRVDANPDIRILIATPSTTDRLCAPLATRGRLSCRNGESVVLNAWRWANGADTFAGHLAAYREYMVNHEVGHALGHRHEICPGRGLPAPVMVQQTKGLDGCHPNPWPEVA